jgi:type I restriction enzyme S subunit
MSHDSCANEINEWPFTPLKAEVTLRNGKSYNSKDWKTEGYPIIRIQNLKNPQAEFNYFQGDLEAEVQISSGDLVFSWSGSKGTSFGPHIWRGELGVLNQHIFKVEMRPNSQLLQDFLYYALRLLTAEIEDKAYGLAALVHVRKGDLESTLIPLPPLKEQKKIAHILSSVQQAIEAQERIIQTTTELKQALMQKLFSEGLRGEPQKETEIGLVPESWEVVPLSDVCRFQSGGTPSKQNPDFWQGTIPWVSPKDMKRPRLNDVADHISQEALESGSKLAPAGSVFVVVRGMILAKTVPVALATVPMAINQDLKAIVPGAELRSDFLLYALETFRESLFNKVGRSGHGTATLMGYEVAAFKIPLPDMQTQEEIASAIKNLERKKELHEQKHTSIQALFCTLLHELMTAKTRVNQLNLNAELIP